MAIDGFCRYVRPASVSCDGGYGLRYTDLRSKFSEFRHTNDFLYMPSEGTAGTNRNRGTDRYATGQGTGHWAQPRGPLD